MKEVVAIIQTVIKEELQLLSLKYRMFVYNIIIQRCCNDTSAHKRPNETDFKNYRSHYNLQQQSPYRIWNYFVVLGDHDIKTLLDFELTTPTHL